MMAAAGWRQGPKAIRRLWRAAGLQGLLSRLHIGTRLAVMMVLAVMVAGLLAAAGIRGLAAPRKA